MRIAIDHTTCIGSGGCVVRLEDHCAIESDTSVARVTDAELPPSAEQEGRRAVAMCPSGALTIS